MSDYLEMVSAKSAYLLKHRIKKMKKNVLKVFVSALMVMAAVVNTGCSNEAGLASDVQQEQAATEGTALSFNFDLAGYGKEQSVATRGVAGEAKGRVIAGQS